MEGEVDHSCPFHHERGATLEKYRERPRRHIDVTRRTRQILKSRSRSFREDRPFLIYMIYVICIMLGWWWEPYDLYDLI